ncbi:MAG: type IV secretory system conjugative DNA transfer family protein [Cellvibrionaceae bacterium]|nr:type IV secretory system conjugative DNA transfer family protein [Cellvibrionaceae bacterium]
MPNHRQKPRNGSARFATSDDIKRAGLFADKGTYLGLLSPQSKAITLSGHNSGVVFAGAGGGKLVCNVVEMVLTCDDSLFIYDEKPEIIYITLHHAAAQGKAAYCLNFGEACAEAPWFLPEHGTNPFDILTPDSTTLFADISAVLHYIMVPSGDQKAEFFEARAEDWVSNILFWMIKGLNRVVTVPELGDMLNLIDTDPQHWLHLLNQHLLHCPTASVRRAAGEMRYKRAHASGEFSAVMATIYKYFRFLNLPEVRKVLSRSDFSLATLSREKANLYVCSRSEYADILAPVNRLILGVTTLYKKRYPSLGSLHFIIDEAANIGKMQWLLWLYTGGRSFNMTIKTFWQSIGQVRALYGEEGLQTLLGSSRFQIFHAIRDYPSAKFIADTLGNKTVSYKDSKSAIHEVKLKRELLDTVMRGGDPLLTAIEHGGQKQNYEQMTAPLLSPDEIMTMPEDRQLLLLYGVDCPPIYGYKAPYYTRPKLLGRYMPNPAHPPLNQVMFEKGKPLYYPIRIEKVPPHWRHLPQFQRGLYPLVVTPSIFPSVGFKHLGRLLDRLSNDTHRPERH